MTPAKTLKMREADTPTSTESVTHILSLEDVKAAASKHAFILTDEVWARVLEVYGADRLLLEAVELSVEVARNRRSAESGRLETATEQVRDATIKCFERPYNNASPEMIEDTCGSFNNVITNLQRFREQTKNTPVTADEIKEGCVCLPSEFITVLYAAMRRELSGT